MEAKAIAKYVRVSPRKARLVADLIKGKHIREAEAILRYTPNKASAIIKKVMLSAAANAEKMCIRDRVGSGVVTKIME